MGKESEGKDREKGERGRCEVGSKGWREAEG